MAETPRRRWAGLRPLTDRQKRFVEEYMVDLNATAAAVRAGYRHQDRSFSKLLRLPQLRAAVDEALAEKRRAAELEARDVVAELSRIAFANLLDFVSFDEGTPHIDLEAVTRDAGAAIQRLTIDYHAGPEGERKVRRIRIGLADKNAALRQLTDHLGLLREPAGETKIRLIRVATGVPRAEDYDEEGNFLGYVPEKPRLPAQAQTQRVEVYTGIDDDDDEDPIDAGCETPRAPSF
jgi:phage terminase small subunit